LRAIPPSVIMNSVCGTTNLYDRDTKRMKNNLRITNATNLEEERK
jgi:hypothetical protein